MAATALAVILATHHRPISTFISSPPTPPQPPQQLGVFVLVVSPEQGAVGLAAAVRLQTAFGLVRTRLGMRLV
nr:hypothetical protein [Tanacetum cinerariifolium]